MKTIHALLVAGAFAVLPCGLYSQNAAPPAGRPAHPTREQLEEWRKLPPQERQVKMREWREKNAGVRPGPQAVQSRKGFLEEMGLNGEELQKLPPEERQAKIKAAVEKKRTELKEKKEKGTLTEEETQLAQRLEFMRERREGQQPGGPGGPRGGREEIGGIAKQLGLSHEELQKLPPDERRAKIRAATEKKVAELKEKKEKGTLTDEDKELERKLEEMKRRFEESRRQPGVGGPPPPTQKAPANP